MFSRAMDVHAMSEKEQDREWVHLLLSYLKSFVEDRGDYLLLHDDEKTAYISQLVAAVTDAVGRLEEGIYFLVIMGRGI